ncbi:metal ABC transporter substrate-binding protein [Brevibacterium salitolerans]
MNGSMDISTWPRRYLHAVAGALTGLLLAGCAGAGAADRQEADAKPLALTTFTVLADIAQNIAGDEVEVASLTKPGAEIHGYEPTPGDLRTAADADLLIDNGLGLEAWFEQFVAELDVPRAVASEGIEPIDIAEDAYAGRPNPHAWMSPLVVQDYADNLVDAFSELVPGSRAEFEQNATAYKEELQSVHDSLTEALDGLPAGTRTLVTCEGAFSYLARDAGLEEEFLWAVNAENEATPQQIRDVIEYVEAEDVPTVFCESTVSDRGMQRVVEATGAEFGGTLYVDSLSAPGGEVPTYLDLIRHDAEVIAAGLGAGHGTGLEGSGA